MLFFIVCWKFCHICYFFIKFWVCFWFGYCLTKTGSTKFPIKVPTNNGFVLSKFRRNFQLQTSRILRAFWNNTLRAGTNGMTFLKTERNPERNEIHSGATGTERNGKIDYFALVSQMSTFSKANIYGTEWQKWPEFR